LRNGLFWDGESIALGYVFRIFGNSPEMPKEATVLENLNQMVWWREEFGNSPTIEDPGIEGGEDQNHQRRPTLDR
jgi:hypothetical protein